jgi:hypothetical protein
MGRVWERAGAITIGESPQIDPELSSREAAWIGVPPEQP